MISVMILSDPDPDPESGGCGLSSVISIRSRHHSLSPLHGSMMLFFSLHYFPARVIPRYSESIHPVPHPQTPIELL
jgi:hypothetical protein